MNIKITLNISKFYEACLKSWNTEYKLTQKKCILLSCARSHTKIMQYFSNYFLKCTCLGLQKSISEFVR